VKEVKEVKEGRTEEGAVAHVVAPNERTKEEKVGGTGHQPKD
jgi:hypothetical protein